ncbi:hypothetical protein PMAYCL1PPCAC_04083, partial [Pristionchus mayeri]
MDEGVLSQRDAIYDGILGILMLSTNLTIFVFIQIHRTLRKEKEYILLGMLVFFNSILGALLMYQAYYQFSFEPIAQVLPRSYCFRHPHIIFIPATAVIISLILPFMALDRLIAVIRPIYYYTLDRHCACKLAAVIVVLYVGIAVFLNISGRHGPPVTPHCHPLEIYNHNTILFQFATVSLGHLASVIIYLLVIVALRKQICAMTVKSEHRDLILSTSPHTLDRRNRSVERTFGIFAAATFLLMVLPTGMLTVFEFFMDDRKDIVRIHALSLYRVALKFCAMNPTLNVVVYALKHKQIYNGLRQVFIKKHSSGKLIVTHSQHASAKRAMFKKSNEVKSVATSIDNDSVSFKDVTLKFNFCRFPDEISKVCAGGNLTLLVVVQSAPSSFKIRDVIRSTWADNNNVASLKSESAKVVFLIGNGDTPTKELQKEMDTHQDIISVDTEDSYKNLIFKTALTLHISQTRCQTSFLLKVDEDVVFNIDRFMDGIDSAFHSDSAAIYCKTWQGARPSRDVNNAWYVSERQFRGFLFPEYCAGPSYVLTSSAVTALLNSLPNFDLITVEDVFVTGIVAQSADVKRIGMESRFNSDYSSQNYTASDCPGELLSVHNLKTEKQIRDTWSFLSRKC